MDVLKEHKRIRVSLLKNNNGQFIDIGIPKNPRIINKDNFELLLDSLKESDLTQIRPLDVLQHGEDYVVLSGNQRLRALKKLKIKEVPCNVLRDDLDPKIYRQIVMQANTNYGEWNHEDLANEWSEEELEMWGYDVPEIDEDELGMSDCSDEFTLKDGDKDGFRQITFTFSNEQANVIEDRIKEFKQTDEYKYLETFGNSNANGNALYGLVQ